MIGRVFWGVGKGLQIGEGGGDFEAQMFSLAQKPIDSTRSPNLALLPLFHKYNVVCRFFVVY